MTRISLSALLVALAASAALLSSGGPPAHAAPPGPVLVVAAHPDDEALGMAGVIANARAAGRRVYVAIATNGDQGGVTSTSASYCGLAAGAGSDAAALGLRRDAETIAAMGELGLQWTTNLASTDIFFLGYPDARTTQVANSTTGITTDGTGLHTTYARASDGSSADTCRGEFGYLLNGQHSTLDRVAFARDMDDLLELTQPADIYTHSTFEGHADHREVARQVIAAVIRSHGNITVHGTLIHPEGTDGCSTLSSFQWPNPAGDTTTDPGLRFTPALDFTAPPIPTCSSSPTSTSWGPAGAPTETPTVPTSMQAASEASNLKWKAISDYASQLNCEPPGPNWHFSCGYMRAFVKDDEIFWAQQFGVGLPLSYENTVIADPNLDSLWRFGESSGTVATATHGSHPGTYVNATLASPGLLTDDADTAAGFDGTASVGFGDVYDFSGTTPFTLEAWVKPTTVDGTARRIFSKEPVGPTDEGWFLINSTTDTLKFARIHADEYDTVTTDAPLDANATSYVAVTYDGTNIRLFVNGVQEAVSPSTGAVADTAAAFTVGAKTGGSAGEWEGTIDEPAVYAAALTPATITNHYLAGIDAAGPPDSTAPGKPATPTASAQDEVAHVDLPTPNPEADIASYTVERKRSSAPASAWTEVATGITTWPVTTGGIANGVSYDYRVIALDASGNLSTPSDPVSVTATDTIAPARPAAPVATALDGAASIALSAPNTDGDLASYTLERRFAADPASWGTAATGITSWPVTDGALGNGTAYDYRVIAVDTSGLRSAPSPTATVIPAATPAPSTPAPDPDPILPPIPTLDTSPPSLRVSATTAHSARYVLRAGLRMRLRCSEACTGRARLVLDAATARRAGLTHRLVADRRIVLGAGDATTVVLKLSAAARRRLARLRRTTAALRLRVTDAAGNAATSSRRIVLR